MVDASLNAFESLGFRPEDDPVFRMAQLLIVLSELGETGETMDRLAYVDFLASHPFLVVETSSADREHLVLLGFETASLDYLSPSHLFATRRELVAQDLARLVAYGFAIATGDLRRPRYASTSAGRSSSDQITSMYAVAVRASAKIVARAVRRLSDKALAAAAREWIAVERTGPAILVGDDDEYRDSPSVASNGAEL